MKDKNVLAPAVGAILVAGCVTTLFSGGVFHWLPIVLALGVVVAICGSAGR